MSKSCKLYYNFDMVEGFFIESSRGLVDNCVGFVIKSRVLIQKSSVVVLRRASNLNCSSAT